MHERIKMIRESSGLSTRDFAAKIGISAATISLMENAKRTITDRTLKDICREFRVNEKWLRTGEGEKYVKRTEEEELALMFNQMIHDDIPARRRFINAISKLSIEEWEVLEKLAKEMINEKDQ